MSNESDPNWLYPGGNLPNQKADIPIQFALPHTLLVVPMPDVREATEPIIVKDIKDFMTKVPYQLSISLKKADQSPFQLDICIDTPEKLTPEGIIANSSELSDLQKRKAFWEMIIFKIENDPLFQNRLSTLLPNKDEKTAFLDKLNIIESHLS